MSTETLAPGTIIIEPKLSGLQAGAAREWTARQIGSSIVTKGDTAQEAWQRFAEALTITASELPLQPTGEKDNDLPPWAVIQIEKIRAGISPQTPPVEKETEP